MIGSLRTCHVIGTWSCVGVQLQVSIQTFCNRILVIGYPHDFHINYACFNDFLRNVFNSFQNLLKALPTFSFKRNSQKTFLFRNWLQIRLISNRTQCPTIHRVTMLIISNWPCTSPSSDFEITRDYSLNCTPLGPITITKC